MVIAQCGFLGVLLLIPVIPRQESVKLSEASAAGDRSFNTEQVSFRFTMRLKSGGQLSEPFRYSMTGETHTTERVVATDGRGKSTSVRKVYHRARERETTPEGVSSTGSKSYEGKTVTLRKGPKRTTVRSSAPISKEDRRELEQELQGPSERFYPSGPVTIGQTWTLSAPEIAKFFGGENARVTGKLVEVAPHQGHKSARMEVAVEFSGKIPGAPIYMRVRMEGEVWHSLDIQRVLSVHLSGPVTIQGSMVEGGQKVDVTGEGRARMELAAHWYEVGGRPAKGSLAAAAPAP